MSQLHYQCHPMSVQHEWTKGKWSWLTFENEFLNSAGNSLFSFASLQQYLSWVIISLILPCLITTNIFNFNFVELSNKRIIQTDLVVVQIYFYSTSFHNGHVVFKQGLGTWLMFRK